MGGGGGQEEETVCMCSEEMVAGQGQSPKLELEPLSPFLTVSTASLLLCMSFHQLFKSCFWVETWKDNIIPRRSLFKQVHYVEWKNPGSSP